MTARATGWASGASWEALLGPADWFRTRCLRASSGWIRPFIVDRDLRVATAGDLLVTIWLSLALVSPFWLLALGPIVWGVPHVVSDLRYLVVRPGYHRRWTLWAGIGLPLIATAQGGGLKAGLAGAAIALLLARGGWRRKLLGFVPVAVVMALAWRYGRRADLVFSYAHNYIAIAIGWAWRPRRQRWHWTIPGLVVAGSLLIISGGPGGWTDALSLSGFHPEGMGPRAMVRAVAPGVTGVWAIRLAVLFAFTQAVHYTVWIRLVPEDDRPRHTPRTFVASYRALRADMGGGLVCLSILAALAVAAWAVVDLAGAREGYLRMALFHGHLELAAAALLWVEGRPRCSAG